MAENNTGPLSGIVSTLLSNPALVKAALSLFSSGNGSAGGASGSFDLGAVLNLLGGSGSTSSPASENPLPKEDEKPFDLEAFLKTLPKPEDSGTENEPANAIETSAENDASDVLMPVSKRHPRRHSAPFHSDTALLLALRPYLNADRRAMIDNIVRVGRLMDTLRTFNTKDGSL